MTTRRHLLKMALATAAASLPEMPVASTSAAELPPIPIPERAGTGAHDRAGVSVWDDMDPPEF